MKPMLARQLLALSLLLTGVSASASEPHLWQEFMFREWQSERWQTYTWAELRWQPGGAGGRLATSLVQQKVHRRLGEHLYFGGGPALIRLRDDAGQEHRIGRAEFEVNASRTLAGNALGNTRAQLRGRGELRWLERQDWQRQWWSRYRLRLSHRRSDATVMRIDASNEWFIDHASGRFRENRFRPLDAHVRLTPILTANGFLQIRSRRPADGGHWQHVFMLGMGLRLDPTDG